MKRLSPNPDEAAPPVGPAFSENEQYREALVNTSPSYYERYVRDIKHCMGKISNQRFLDVGCGIGTVLRRFGEGADVYGIDISNLFLGDLKDDGYRVQVYDGRRIPFADGFFGVVGSFTVLEHTKDPVYFLAEKVRVLGDGGYLIVSCPNFLSVFNRVRNYSLLYKLTRLGLYGVNGTGFTVLDPIVRPIFFPDDDAIVQTNPIHVVRAIRKMGLQIEMLSGIAGDAGPAISLIARIPLLRLLLPSCHIIARKPLGPEELQ